MDYIQKLRRWKRLNPSHFKETKKFTLARLLMGLPCTRNIQISFEELRKYGSFTI